MKISKVFKVFKKGSKAAGKVKGKKGEGGKFDWPDGLRVGLFGHSNSGKTVYLTVLNEDCKISRNLQISVTDNPTASEFLSNYRMLWGLGTATDAGTVVDLKGERKFPESTVGDNILQFNAILDQTKKLPVVTYDYNGAALSISKTGEVTDKVIDFLSNSDGLFFFFDPKILSAELQVQEHVAAFVNMLQRLAPLDARIPIPMALVINKAEVLPGFTGEDQTVLIGPDEEHFVSEDFDIFLDRVLGSNRIAANSVWAGTVRTVLVKLREFLRVVVGRTLDFQIFFVSNTGEPPEKIGADVGRSIYAPPAKIRPIGVKEPFYWLLRSILRNRRITKLRKVAKFVAILSLAWIALFSLPNLYHFMFLIPRTTNVETNILKNYNGDPRSTIGKEQTEIKNAYQRYKNKWIVRQMFPAYQVPATKIADAYGNFNIDKSLKKLDGLMMNFAAVVGDSTQWPGYNFSTGELITNAVHSKLIADITSLRGENEDSKLYARGSRTLALWDLFTKYIASARDTIASSAIVSQLNVNSQSGQDRSTNEDKLAEALLKVTKKRAAVVEQAEDTQQALVEFENIKEKIAGSTDPNFILGSAVRQLKSIRNKLKPSRDKVQLAMIAGYLKTADKWKEKRTFKYKIEAIPDNGHLHLEVTSAGSSPNWDDQNQLFEGEEKLKWKVGDHVHIMFDEEKFDCQWGNLASDKKILSKGKYSIFDMQGEIIFKNIEKTVSISFTPSLKDLLPRLE